MAPLKFTRIPNALIEALTLRTLSAYQYRVILCLARHTFGYHRHSWRVSTAALARIVGIPRASVHKTLKQLVESGCIGSNEHGAWHINPPEKWRT